MGQLVIDGTITIGPTSGGSGGFPVSTSSATVASTPAPKSSSVDTGFTVRNIATPNAYIALTGVGAADSVTQCDTFTIRSQSALRVRITFSDTPSDLVSELVVMGTLLIEAPPQSNTPAPNYIKLIEVKGAGIIEYLASGLA